MITWMIAGVAVESIVYTVGLSGSFALLLSSNEIRHACNLSLVPGRHPGWPGRTLIPSTRQHTSNHP